MLAAVLIRIVYFWQINGTVFVDMSNGPQTDMNYYSEWADSVVAGDLWSSGVQVPQHAWHEDVAAEYFRQHPGTLRRVVEAGGGEGANPVAMVWSRWLHVPQFYQDALYPYLIAVTRLVLGPDVRWVFAWQLLLGVMSTVLIWDLTRRVFGDRVGLVAGGIALLTAPLLYYELLLLRESTIVFAGLAATWLAADAFRHTGQAARWRFLWLGLLLGLSVLLKSSLLLFVAGFSLAIAATYRQTPRTLMTHLGVFAVGLLVGISPLVVRNLTVGVPPFALASGGPLTFVVSNESTNQPSRGNYVNSTVLARFLGNTDGGWRSAFVAAFGEHTTRSYLRLLGEKWYWAWHWYELPNNDNFYFRRGRIPILRWLPVTAWFISPLALVGLVIGVRRLKDAWPLYLLLLLSLLPLLGFYVIGRFRVVLLAASIPFAALTVVAMIDALRRSHVRQLAAVTAGVLIVGVWTSRPLDPGMHLLRTDDWILPYTVRYQPRMREAGERGNFQTAASACDASFNEAPTNAEILASGDPDLPLLLADIRRRCEALWQLGGNGPPVELPPRDR